MSALRAFFVAILFAACVVASRPPIDSTTGRASVLELEFAVQISAAQCTANANHLERFDAKRSEALVDACVRALIPARDAVVFVAPVLKGPWSSSSSAAVGCAGKAVRVALERIRKIFIEAGYGGLPDAALAGLRLGERLEPWALETCDPLHPTTERSVFEDPNIARVAPEYP